MIVCLFGRTADPWVGPVLADMQEAATASGVDLAALSIETAVRAARQWESVRRLYVLPFEIPPALPDGLPMAPPLLLRALFPRAEVINSPAVHELCWDKLDMATRLLERGVPMPESLITSDAREATDFVRHHQQAILKEPRSCGGHGHVVLAADHSGALAGEVPGRRYVVELVGSGVGRSLAHGVLTCPPPFYLQRLVTDVGRNGVLTPAQLLRAYVVDGQILFWTERFRDKARRPGDFIVNTTFGARYRFLPEVSEAAQTVARRAVEVLGVRVGAVDLIRAGSEGPDVIEVDTDGYHMLIDRSFKRLPEYRAIHDFDRFIIELLAAAEPEPPRRAPRPGERRTTVRSVSRPRGPRRPPPRRRSR
jgi:glutathione synthase/RimK-type ligase-like ATP-grasp enzyme